MAAGRISVHLSKTSRPPGRGSTAEQTLAPPGSGRGRCSLGLCHAWPGLSVLPVAGVPVAMWAQGRHCACSAPGCSLRAWGLEHPCSIHAAPVLPMATTLCEHQPGLGVPRGRWGLCRLQRTPQPFGDGCAAMSPGEVQREEAPGSRGMGAQAEASRGLSWRWGVAWSAVKREAADPPSGEMCLRTGNLAACQGAYRCSANSQWQQH